MRYSLPSLALLSLIPSVIAAPAPAAVPVRVFAAAPTPAPSLDDAKTLQKRQLLGGVLNGALNRVDGALNGVLDGVQSAVAARDPAAVGSALAKIAALNRPTDVADAMTRASQIWASPSGRTDFYPAIATQVAAGLGPLLDGTLITALTGGFGVGENSFENNNPQPSKNIYNIEGDAPYSQSEDVLRKAIFIPQSFSYGAGTKRPVILIPGTGGYGGTTFQNNMRKLLQGQPFADPVWLNIPGAGLGDAQVNSEFVAYAINYISAISKSNANNLAVLSWSQGSPNAQWAFKYWPSTRAVVQDFLPVSADFKGTIFANALCLAPASDLTLNPLCPLSLIQQEATSNYIKSLRSDGGDSAYVPTTTFYSGFFDEIVEPQQGDIASGYMKDERGVGVSNNEVQSLCAGSIAGAFYGHAGVLFHPLTYALVVDALTNDGPGRTSRIDLTKVCSSFGAPGLDLDDVIATSGLIPIAAVLILTTPDKGITEPSLMSYAK